MSSSKIHKETDQFIPRRLTSVSPGPAKMTLSTAPDQPPPKRGGEEPFAAAPTPASGTADFALELEQTKAESYRRGKKEGMEQAAQEFNDAVRALGLALEEISRLRESIYDSNAEDMLRLVLAISQQVLQQEIAAREDVILTTLQNALQMSIKAEEFHIRINPEDYQLVTDRKPLFLASISGLKNITFEPDPNIGRGGCKVSSTLGEVDATIEGQFAKISEHLLKAVRKEG